MSNHSEYQDALIDLAFGWGMRHALQLSFAEGDAAERAMGVANDRIADALKVITQHHAANRKSSP